MELKSTAILLTPPGAGAIAVVRLVGPQVRSFLGDHFSKPLRENSCVHGTLADGERVIDDPVVVLAPGGQLADVNLHGGPWVVRSTFDLARRAGFEIVERIKTPLADQATEGETEIEREVLAYLPLARTEEAIRMLLSQPQAWNEISDRTEMVGDRSLWWMLHPPRVAIAGAANVGKSTLANQLFAQARSIMADLPGTTRDWVGEIANIDGLAVMLLDTPGIRATDDAIEATAIERAGGELLAADLVLLVVDPTQPMEPQTILMERFPTAIRIVNKADIAAVDSMAGLRTVATTGAGLDAVRKAIREYFQIDQRPGLAKCWTERQRAVVFVE